MTKPLIILLSLSVSAPATADQFSLGTGFDYSTGKYGTNTSTDILSIPVTATYETGKATFKLTVPYISITSAGGVIPGVGNVGNAGPGGTSVGVGRRGNATITASGLGDIITSAAFSVYGNDALLINLAGKIKFGTADETKGLGTGKNDYSLQADGTYTITRQTSAFASVGYKKVGVPTGWLLRNVVYGTLGVDQKLEEADNAGAMLNAAQSPSPSGVAPLDLTVYYSLKLGDEVKAQVHLLKGLSNGSPDLGVGAMISIYF